MHKRTIRSTENYKPSSGLTLTIDPGIGRTGLALWRNDEWDKLEYPLGCENITPGCTGTWEKRAQAIVNKLDEFVYNWSKWGNSEYNLENGNHTIDRAYIEMPKFFSDKSEGEREAKTGALGKLYMLVGMYCCILWENNVDVHLVRVDDWKGTLPKDAVINFIERRLPDIRAKLDPKLDSWDSIGIGLGVRDMLIKGK